MYKRRVLSVAISLCGGFAGLTQAAPVLDEVVVTAQKTEETIQSVPISIQALDAKTLARPGNW
jgi:outer membrane receptor protein involved in Fe transport